MNGKSIVIIGAGAGGCATAARLAKEGLKVTVYEKNSFGGGRCSIINANGHRFDQGPSLYLMPEIFEETFKDLDENINDHIELLKCPTNYNVYFHDGETIELTCDLAKMCSSIEKFEGDDEKTVQKFLTFLAEAKRHYTESVALALKTNYSSIFSLLKLKYLPKLYTTHLYDTAYNRAAKYFKSDHLRRAFSFQSMYIGMSPFDAPGNYTLLQATEFFNGIWYPKGGFYQVLNALENIAKKKYGAEFVFNCGVKKINIDKDGKATGVTLDDGRVVNADAVLCNADLVYAYNKLLPDTNYGKNLGEHKRLTSSSISFYWCIKQKVPELSVHNIFLAEKYKESFDEIFNDKTLPKEASFYVNVPSKIDLTAAPENKETIIVLIPTGHITEENYNNIDQIVKNARNQVIQKIEKLLKIENFSELIEHEIVNDPHIWKEKFNLWKGSILGLSHNIFQTLCFRPSMKSSEFKNLYFCGASAHPGTGVPVVISGAKLASEQIAIDFGLRKSANDDYVTALILVLFLLAVFVFYKMFM